MIKVDEIEDGILVWLVSQKIEEMVYPKQVKYMYRESTNGVKLAFISVDDKRVCCPTHLLFTSKIEAQIYGSINFLKLYYNFDPFFVSANVDENVLLDAYSLVEQYEEEDPSTFLYHWMGNVPSR